MGERRPQEEIGFTSYKYDGVTYHAVVVKKDILRKIEETCFKDDDIIISTYPKSGQYTFLNPLRWSFIVFFIHSIHVKLVTRFLC